MEDKQQKEDNLNQQGIKLDTVALAFGHVQAAEQADSVIRQVTKQEQDWDSIKTGSETDRDNSGTGPEQDWDRTGAGLENTVILPIDTWQEYQKERDTLRDGLMMYRFQFEELARRLKALPVPPELVAEKLRKQEEELKKKTELEAKLQEEQKARADLEAKANKLVEELEAEKKRSWWKKLFGIK